MKPDYLPVVAFNGQLMDSASVRISPLSPAFMFGRGLFETIRVARGRAVFLADHWARIRRGCAELGIDWSTNHAELRRRCDTVIERNFEDGDGVLKLMVFADVEGAGELIAARSYPYSPADFERGFRLVVRRDVHRGGTVSALKSLNYLDATLAREEARQKGFDDALFTGSDGQVLECASANLFVVIAGQIHTPALDEGILPGIARSQVVRRWNDPKPLEGRITIERLQAADELFATNALLGIMPVSALDDRTFDLSRNPFTRRLMTEYATWMEEER